jgi:hypothetical protein
VIGADAGIANEVQPGDMALDYVTDDRFPTLLIEVDYVEGHQPSPAALTRLSDVLARRLQKPGGVDFLIDSAIPASTPGRLYSDRDIRELEGVYRQRYSGGRNQPDRAVAWVVYLDGNSELDDAESRALGVAIGGSQIALFPASLDEVASPDERESLEAVVLLHEFGHLFGLVNNGVPMVGDHEDREHPLHDVNPDCVMHYRIEARMFVDAVQDLPLDFGPDCRLDLHKVGGLEPTGLQ